MQLTWPSSEMQTRCRQGLLTGPDRSFLRDTCMNASLRVVKTIRFSRVSRPETLPPHARVILLVRRPSAVVRSQWGLGWNGVRAHSQESDMQQAVQSLQASDVNQFAMDVCATMLQDDFAGVMQVVCGVFSAHRVVFSAEGSGVLNICFLLLLTLFLFSNSLSFQVMLSPFKRLVVEYETLTSATPQSIVSQLSSFLSFDQPLTVTANVSRQLQHALRRRWMVQVCVCVCVCVCVYVCVCVCVCVNLCKRALHMFTHQACTDRASSACNAGAV